MAVAANRTNRSNTTAGVKVTRKQQWRSSGSLAPKSLAWSTTKRVESSSSRPLPLHLPLLGIFLLRYDCISIFVFLVADLGVFRFGYASIEKQRQRLPVYKYRTAILYLVEKHATTIIVGETGSGKTTQIPQAHFPYL